MAKISMAYDHPTYITRQASHLPLVAAAASTTTNKFLAFTAMKVKSINVAVQIAGTATAAGYDFLNGTSSVGEVVLGTAAAGTFGTEFATDITLASGGYVDFKTKAASATLAGVAVVEFEIIKGATVED